MAKAMFSLDPKDVETIPLNIGWWMIRVRMRHVPTQTEIEDWTKLESDATNAKVREARLKLEDKMLQALTVEVRRKLRVSGC